MKRYYRRISDTSDTVEQETLGRKVIHRLTARRRINCEKDLPVIRLVNDRFWNVSNYRTYCLAGKLSRYDEEVAQSVARWAKRVQVQVKLQKLESFDINSIISFLALKCVCDTNRVHKGATLWLLHLFMKRSTAATRNVRLALRSKSRGSQKEYTVSTYCKAVNYSVEMYATDEVNAETDADMMHLTQPSNKSPTEYAEGLWNKALRCNRVYEEYMLKVYFY